VTLNDPGRIKGEKSSRQRRVTTGKFCWPFHPHLLVWEFATKERTVGKPYWLGKIFVTPFEMGMW